MDQCPDGNWAHTAKGEDLDRLAALTGLERKEAEPAKIATPRQAAKSFNFGHRPAVPPVDGMAPAEIFRLFEMMQREDARAFRVVDGKSVPILTATQIAVARAMWTARVSIKSDESARADADSRPSIRCQGDHTDDLENL